MSLLETPGGADWATTVLEPECIFSDHFTCLWSGYFKVKMPSVIAWQNFHNLVFRYAKPMKIRMPMMRQTQWEWDFSWRFNEIKNSRTRNSRWRRETPIPRINWISSNWNQKHLRKDTVWWSSEPESWGSQDCNIGTNQFQEGSKITPIRQSALM